MIENNKVENKEKPKFYQYSHRVRQNKEQCYQKHFMYYSKQTTRNKIFQNNQGIQAFAFIFFVILSIIVSILVSIYYRNSVHHQTTTLQIKAMCGKYVHGHFDQKTQKIKQSID